MYSTRLCRLQEYYSSISKGSIIQRNFSFSLDLRLTIPKFYSHYFSYLYSYWISQSFILHDHLVGSFIINGYFLCFDLSTMNCCHCYCGKYLRLSIFSHLASRTAQTNYYWIRKTYQTHQDDRTQ